MSVFTSPDFRLWTLGAFVAAIGFIYALDPGHWVYDYGIYPREKSALIGIVALPFLHGSPTHVLLNMVFLVINFGQRATIEHWNFWGFIIIASLASGAIVWAFHPDTDGLPIVGASALIFASIGHGLMTSIEYGDWVGPSFLAAQAWVLWPLWQVMLVPGTGIVDLYGFEIDGTNVSVFGHWAGLGVGAAISWFKGTTW